MPVVHSLYWLPVNFRIHFNILVFTYRAIYHQAPANISDPLHPYVLNRSPRSSNQGLLVVPHSCLKPKGDHAFEEIVLTGLAG